MKQPESALEDVAPGQCRPAMKSFSPNCRDVRQSQGKSEASRGAGERSGHRAHRDDDRQARAARASGLGKTLLVRTLSQVMNMSFSRIQFTPDLMPSDITGTNMLVETAEAAVRFSSNLGRCLPTSSWPTRSTRYAEDSVSLLEAMQEGSVTVFGERHVLSQPFLVMATRTRSNSKALTHCLRPAR